MFTHLVCVVLVVVLFVVWVIFVCLIPICFSVFLHPNNFYLILVFKFLKKKTLDAYSEDFMNPDGLIIHSSPEKSNRKRQKELKSLPP